MTTSLRLADFTILIVDDDLINRVILKELLEELKLPIEEAKNGEEALQIMIRLKNKPVILLLDLNMPLLDGYEVIKVMSNDRDVYKKIKTIVVSGSLRSTFEKTGLSSHITSYIEKPFDSDVLIQHIKNAASDGLDN